MRNWTPEKQLNTRICFTDKNLLTGSKLQEK